MEAKQLVKALMIFAVIVMDLMFFEFGLDFWLGFTIGFLGTFLIIFVVALALRRGSWRIKNWMRSRGINI